MKYNPNFHPGFITFCFNWLCLAYEQCIPFVFVSFSSGVVFCPVLEAHFFVYTMCSLVNCSATRTRQFLAQGTSWSFPGWQKPWKLSPKKELMPFTLEKSPKTWYRMYKREVSSLYTNCSRCNQNRCSSSEIHFFLPFFWQVCRFTQLIFCFYRWNIIIRWPEHF